MLRRAICGPRGARRGGRLACAVALALAGEAGAEALFARTTATGEGPEAVIVADLDRDGIPDLVTANFAGDDVSVLFGNGDGSFQPPVSFAVGDSPSSVAAADFDGDGVLDLVTVNRASDDVSVLLGDGLGGFRAATAYPAGRYPDSLAVADLDRDGFADLGTLVNDEVSVLFGNGDGSFQTPVFLTIDDPLYASANALAAADLNADGAPDFVAAISYLWGGSISVLLGKGDGSFEPPLSIAIGDYQRAAAVADIDEDGAPDVLTLGNRGVWVSLGNGDGSLQPASPYYVSYGARALAVVDLDADGALDAATADGWSTGSYIADLSVLLGNGDGGFRRPLSFSAGRASGPIAAADLDRDGVVDLASPNYLDNEVSVLLGRGGGRFEAGESFVAYESPYSAAVADLDEDGFSDFAIQHNLTGRSTVSVYLGNGDGSFHHAHAINRPFLWFGAIEIADLDRDGILDIVSGPYVLLGNGDARFEEPARIEGGYAGSIADLDGDGIPDLVADGAEVAVLRGNGDGSFGLPAPVDAGEWGYGSIHVLALTDLDGDAVPDLVLANHIENDLRLLFGNGDGSFRGSLSIETNHPIQTGAAADLNGDGIPDLVTPFDFGHGVRVMLGRGDGSFESAATAEGIRRVQSLVVADFDADRIPDIAAVGSNSAVYLLIGIGDGTFQEPVIFWTGELPLQLLAADFDRDGLGDLASVQLTSGDFHGWGAVTVFLNLAEPPVRPEIDIKPGSDLNSANPSSKGSLPVALLGSERFDVRDVDGATLAFGPGTAGLAHRDGPHLEDVDDDGFADLLAHFRVAESGLAPGDVEACLSGALLDGRTFAACDAVRTVLGVDRNASLDLPPRRREGEP